MLSGSQGGAFDVGGGIEERAERPHPVRRRLHLGRERARAQVADVAVARQLHPGPAVLLLVDGDQLAEQDLAGPACARSGRARSGVAECTTCRASPAA